MNKNQIQWASEHDWFVCDNGNGSITCRDGEATVTHNNFQALRDWAGY